MAPAPHDDVLVPPARLLELCVHALRGAGVGVEEAFVVADSLVDASLRGIDSHGVNLLPDYLERIAAGGWVTPSRARVVSEHGAVALLDGGSGLGAVAGTRAMRAAIRIAGDHGAGVVAVRNSSHFGAGGYYARLALGAGMIGCSFTNASPAMAPAGGVERLLSNNPWAIAVPSNERCAVVLDIANSVVARSRIRLAAQRGQDIPQGWAQTRDGADTTDPLEALAGSMLPFASYKGYGIAFMVDVLAGVLSGSAFGPEVGAPFSIDPTAAGGDPRRRYPPQDVGHLFVAIDVERFRPIDHFKRDVSAMVARLRESRARPGVDRVRVPGDPECERAVARAAHGIPVRRETLAGLTQWAGRATPGPR